MVGGHGRHCGGRRETLTGNIISYWQTRCGASGEQTMVTGAYHITHLIMTSALRNTDSSSCLHSPWSKFKICNIGILLDSESYMVIIPCY